MNAIEIIEAKKTKRRLSREQIRFFVSGLVRQTIPDYQISALLMAIWFNGLDADELYHLTEAMIDSGKVYSFRPGYAKTLIDKHSTGGIGDKVSVALAPVLAALGFGVVKLSGRGLGFTGGTIDKIESLGARTEISMPEAKKILRACDMFIIGQSSEIVPADKLLYALRDVTGTIDSLPLIAASILSKKFALESDYVFIDIKYGEGAFCGDAKTARKLRATMEALAKRFKREVRFALSDMNEVLGNTIGNALEMKEAIGYLRNDSGVGEDFRALMEELVTMVLLETKKCAAPADARRMLRGVLDGGSAYERFRAWIGRQGGDLRAIDADAYFRPKHSLTIKAPKAGTVACSSVVALANVAVDLGSGRRKKTDAIDFHAGILLHKKARQRAAAGEKLLTLYSSSPIPKGLADRAREIVSVA